MTYLFYFTDEGVDMLDWFSKLTLEVILCTAFGVDANIQLGENTEMLEKAKALFQTPGIVRQLARLPFGKSLLSWWHICPATNRYIFKALPKRS